MKKKFVNSLKIIILVFVTLVLFFWILPFGKLKKIQNQSYSTRFLDCNGRIIQIVPIPNKDGLRREFTKIEDIPQEIIDAFIEAEDKRFFKHHGVDLLAIFRATRQNISEKKTVSGASTITMQLARIVSPSKNRNVFTKLREAFNAFRIECKLSKKEILELYLNNLPFGFQVEGVTSAARTFFNRGEENPLLLLKLSEVEILAKIPRRPQSYAPKTNHYQYPFHMPHYINFLCSEMQKNKISFPPQINLYVDLNIHLKAENLLSDAVIEFADARLTNGAVYAIENSTGNVLAWIGSANFFDTFHNGQIDGVLVTNQPGSSMKPFLYASALENGFLPNQVLPDIPCEYGLDEVYIPRNFNDKYNGPIRFRISLASSLNVPAVFILHKIGMSKYLVKLLQLNFNSLKPGLNNIKNPSSHTAGLSLALGGAEVSLYEMVNAFSVFANDGKLVPIFHSDDLKFLKNKKTKKVFSKDTSRLICSILSDPSARTLGFGNAKVFETTFPAIFKTGTANQYQNITALASSPLYTVGVWMGNFNGETIIGKTGSSIPAKIANEILTGLQGNEKHDFLLPENFKKETICSVSGMLATENCIQTCKEYIPITANKKNYFCTWHIKENNTISTHYPAEYQAWFFTNKNNYAKRSGSINYQSENLKIVSPKNFSSYIYDKSIFDDVQKIYVEVIGGKTDLLEVYYDGHKIKTVERPFCFYLPVEIGTHDLLVICDDELSQIEFNVN